MVTTPVKLVTERTYGQGMEARDEHPTEIERLRAENERLRRSLSAVAAMATEAAQPPPQSANNAGSL